jgi:hypothetical protein
MPKKRTDTLRQPLDDVMVWLDGVRTCLVWGNASLSASRQ